MALRRRGKPLNGQGMLRHQTLYGHARRLFGSWEKALRGCGLDYSTIVIRTLWTKECRRRRESGPILAVSDRPSS